MEKLKELLSLLALHGGKIVSTAELNTYDIKQAQASGRMYVDENSLGFVWLPEFVDFPKTKEEIENFEKWFPIDIDMPEELKTLDWYYKLLKKQP